MSTLDHGPQIPAHMQSKNNRIVTTSVIAVGFLAAIFTRWFTIQTPMGPLEVDGLKGNIQLVGVLPIWFLAVLSFLGAFFSVLNAAQVTSFRPFITAGPILFSGAFYLTPLFRLYDNCHFGLFLAVVLTVFALPSAFGSRRYGSNQLPDPTSPSVTPPAGAGGAPSVAADH